MCHPPKQGAAATLGAGLLGPHKASLVPPAIHATQHERAGRAGCVGQRDRLYRWLDPRGPAGGYGHLTRSRPQDSAIFIASRWAAKKAPPGSEDSSGARVGDRSYWRFGPS